MLSNMNQAMSKLDGLENKFDKEGIYNLLNHSRLENKSTETFFVFVMGFLNKLRYKSY